MTPSPSSKSERHKQQAGQQRTTKTRTQCSGMGDEEESREKRRGAEAKGCQLLLRLTEKGQLLFSCGMGGVALTLNNFFVLFFLLSFLSFLILFFVICCFAFRSAKLQSRALKCFKKIKAIYHACTLSFAHTRIQRWGEREGDRCCRMWQHPDTRATTQRKAFSLN